MAGWAVFQGFTIKVDRLVDVIGSSSPLKLGDERFRPQVQLFNWELRQFTALHETEDTRTFRFHGGSTELGSAW